VNPKSFDNDGDYVALVYNRDEKGMYVTDKTWVVPLRVYRGGKDRQQIEYNDYKSNEKIIRQNWPGATTFELFKKV
jgi:hypothetical protein